MFLDAPQAFHELSQIRDVEVHWDEAGGHVIVAKRLGRPAASPEVVAAAMSSANSDLGMVGFRLEGERMVCSLGAFLDPDGRISRVVLQRLVEAVRDAVRTFTGGTSTGGVVS